MPFLRQSTSQVVLFGPCLDKTDGVTEETGLTLAQADMRLSKDGGAFAQKSAAGNATHDSDGWYSTTLSTTDTDTVGELRLNVHQPANMLPVWDRWWVIEEAIYDALFGAAAAGFDANGRVDVGSWLGTAAATPTVAGVPEVDITHMVGGVVPTPATTGIPDVNVREWLDTAAATPTVAGVPEVDVTHFVGGVAPTPATTGVPDANTVEFLDTAVVLSAGLPDVNIAATDNVALSAQQKLDVNTEADTALTDYNGPTSAELVTEINSVQTDIAALNDISTAQVNTEVDNAIVTYGLDHLVFVSVTGTDIADNSIIAQMVDDAATADWDGYDNTTASLEALNVDTDAIKAETALIVADTDVIDDGTSGLVKIASDVAAILVDTAVIGALGAGLTDLGGMSTGMKAEVNTEVDGALDTTIPELSQGVPATTPTVRTGIMLPYMALRNKLDVATSGTDTLEVHNDAGTRIAQKLLTDDGSDYSEAKMTSGA